MLRKFLVGLASVVLFLVSLSAGADMGRVSAPATTAQDTSQTDTAQTSGQGVSKR